ncbi:MAG TPA: hypothetical protein VF808_09265 [Ktedonobacterales bacterium]
MRDRERWIAERSASRHPAGLTRDTLLGCFGLGCIMLALPLLWIGFSMPASWAARLIPLAAFGAGAVGVALTMRVPGAAPLRSRDPRRPLTRAGALPVVERPATLGARISFGVAAGLMGCACVGYVVEVVAPGREPPWGLLVSLCAGVSLCGLSVAALFRPAVAPALRWQRLSVGAGAARQAGALAAAGLVGIGATLLLALMDGYWWGEIGLAALILLLVCFSPLARRSLSATAAQDTAESGRWFPSDGQE